MMGASWNKYKNSTDLCYNLIFLNYKIYVAAVAISSIYNFYNKRNVARDTKMCVFSNE